MPLPEGLDTSNVLEFKQKPIEDTSKDKILDQKQTSQAVETVLNGHKPLNKADIIAAIIIGDGEVGDPNEANHMMESDYFDLYGELLDMICTNGGKFYHSLGYNLTYDEETLKIYLSKLNNKDNKAELDIQLIPNGDFSDTTIELSFDNNIMFIANSQGAARTSYTPNQFNKKNPF